MYKKIILPTDGSTYADLSIERATNLIADDGEIIVLSVAGKFTSSAFQSRKRVRKANEVMKKEAKMAVDKMAAKFDDDVNIIKMVKTGFPAETINQVAEEEGADLIVITSSGKSGIHKFIIGSVAEKVLKTSEIDVLLVHNNDE
ncbi:universal stress protein [uncultured Methanobrevibacter sp.]|jgi:nucleotide-binding universal stress UspA family protein|uniref:universal stress protein n=1 Tax=uncultured Methanobrevibacter sp. TaxID=253161 RepID=UPI0025EB8070|nr:universal stress protein [uncultured Methanobrevibacter sp.]